MYPYNDDDDEISGKVDSAIIKVLGATGLSCIVASFAATSLDQQTNGSVYEAFCKDAQNSTLQDYKSGNSQSLQEKLAAEGWSIRQKIEKMEGKHYEQTTFISNGKFPDRQKLSPIWEALHSNNQRCKFTLSRQVDIKVDNASYELLPLSGA